MTLSVFPYQRNSQGKIEWLPTPSDYSDVAGLESMRLSFWGSAALKRLGLSLVITLSHYDIYAEAHDLVVLKQEITILMDYIHTLSPQEQQYWHFILSNILTAIQVAEDVQGGVYNRQVVK